MISTTLIVIIASCAAFVHTAPLTIRDVPAKLDIVDPSYIDISTHSYSVAVTIGLDLLGGGVLVAQRWVLTAASVTHGRNISDLRVRLGSNSAYEGGKLHKVHGVVKYPDYSSNNSLALLYLDRNVSYSVARHISFLARIPFQDNKSYGNITGYGQDSYSYNQALRETAGQSDLSSSHSSSSSSSSSHSSSSSSNSSSSGEYSGLQISKLELYSRDYCKGLYHINVPKNQFCGWSGQDSVPCFGDIGDPLTKCVNYSRCELIGIYTGYNICGVNSHHPQTYIDIGLYRDWIKSIIRQNRTENVETSPSQKLKTHFKHFNLFKS